MSLESLYPGEKRIYNLFCKIFKFHENMSVNIFHEIPRNPCKIAKSKYFSKQIVNRSHYPERASTLDFKYAAAPRFCHSDLVFDLFIETRFYI